jgi:hypothetical protein
MNFIEKRHGSGLLTKQAEYELYVQLRTRIEMTTPSIGGLAAL